MTDTERDALYGEIASRLREAREEKDWSQERLSRSVSVSRTSIVNIEAGRQRPPLHVIWEIAEALGKEPIELIPRKDDLLAPPDLIGQALAKEVKKAARGDQMVARRITRFIETANAAVSEEE